MKHDFHATILQDDWTIEVTADISHASGVINASATFRYQGKVPRMFYWRDATFSNHSETWVEVLRWAQEGMTSILENLGKGSFSGS